ncbi:MAG: dicarboxylate/amino acid:cation symporter [Spirochaetaceae bacterium]|nr:dicarboxylate/amino acid:cation symporter [Spirochaetaceae bacterium]
MTRILRSPISIPLHWQILAALILGGLYGFLLPHEAHYVTWAGDLFLRALRMIVAPLILCSIISGVAGLKNNLTGDSGANQSGQSGGATLGRLGLKTLSYYAITSLLAITVGLILVNLVRPGDGMEPPAVQEASIEVKPLNQTLLEIIPRNVFQALMQDDMLSIIFFAFLAGAVMLRMEKEKGEVLINFFQSAFDLMMRMTDWIVRFAPLGILGIVAGVVSEKYLEGNLLESVKSLGAYMAVVLIALFIHAFVTLFAILRFYGGFNPLKHLKAMSSALLMAFSTSSSSATLPLTMECCEKQAGISNRTTSFVLPLGATVNMDGTALYECVATLFIAQAWGIELTVTQQLIVVFTALLASVGAAGIPMAGLVTITIILSAVGLPAEAVGLIITVDRILDMFRTAVNVWSDSCGAAVIAQSEGEGIYKSDPI